MKERGRKSGTTKKSVKRAEGPQDQNQRPSKRRKYPLVSGWGMAEEHSGAKTTGGEALSEKTQDREDDSIESIERGASIPHPPNQESPGPDAPHPALTRNNPGCPPHRRDSTIPEFFRKVEPDGSFEGPLATETLREGERLTQVNKD